MTSEQEHSEELKLKIQNGHARRMGPTENFFSIWQRQKLYKNFAVIAHFNKDIKSDQKLLSRALRTLLLKYPILLSGIEKTDYSDLSTPRPLHDYLKVHDNLTLDQVIIDFPKELLDIEDKAEQLKYINTEIYWSYEDDDLLWKLGFLDSNTLVYITNHCLSDGISAKYFFEDLLELLNDPEKIKDNTVDYIFNYKKDYKELPKLPPCLTSVVSYTPNFLYFFEYLFNLVVFKNLCYRSEHQPDTKDEFHYRLINIPAADVEGIKKVLGAGSTESLRLTLTPYIQAFWLRSVDEYITPLNNPKLGFHDIAIPGDARQLIPPSVDSDEFRYGANTSGIHKYFTPVKKVDLGIIRYFSGYLKYLFESRKFLYNMGMLTLGFVANNTNLDKSITDELMGGPRNGSLFSNIGLFNPRNSDDDSKLKIDDMIFTANGGTSSSTFSLSTVSTLSGGLNLLVAATVKDIDSETLDKFMDHFKRGLLSYENIN